MDILVICIISYLMGSIPFGLILTKIFLKKDIRDIGSGNIGATNVLRTGNKTVGYILTKIFLKKDIRDVGSGNIGATNALRTGNKFIGYTTLFFDIVKAVIPVIFVKSYYTDCLYLASLCAFIGHVFPVWLKFKGGKGVATYVGILFALNLNFGLIFIVSWFVTFVFSKYSSLSSLVAPMFPEPISLISFLRNILVKIKPNGKEPIK